MWREAEIATSVEAQMEEKQWLTIYVLKFAYHFTIWYWRMDWQLPFIV